MIARTQPLDITRQHVDFEIHAIARATVAERGLLDRMRNQVHAETRTIHRIDGQADAIHAHRALGRDVARQRGRRLDDPPLRTRVGFDGNDAADAVDMPRHEMATQPISKPQRLNREVVDMPEAGRKTAAQREWRQLGLGAQILADLGVHRLRVLGTPRKLVGLSGFDLEVIEYVAEQGLGIRD